MSPETASLVVFGIAAVATFVLTFGVRWIARGRRIVVMPDAERVHTVPTPTLGGVGMFVAFIIAFLAAGRLAPFHNALSFSTSSQPLGVILALAVMFLVGLVDDLREVSAPAKVAGQVIAAMVLVFLGVTMAHVKVPFSTFIVLSPSILPLVTALWVIGIANAVNLIDGLDGLAAGVVGIASGALCIYGLRLEELGVLLPDNIGPIVAAATCGLCVGFLPHNFHRAKIFMGDTGAMVLGLLMAASTMVIGGQAADTSGETYFFFAPLLVPFFILGIPILDTAFAIVRRTAKRRDPSRRDLEHVHHRLMRLGHGHRRAVLLLWGWTLILSALVLYPTFYPKWNAAIPIVAAVLVVGLYTLFRPGRRTVAGDFSPATGEASQGSRPAGVGNAAATHAGQGGHRGQHRRRFARHHPPMRG